MGLWDKTDQNEKRENFGISKAKKGKAAFMRYMTCDTSQQNPLTSGLHILFQFPLQISVDHKVALSDSFQETNHLACLERPLKKINK